MRRTLLALAVALALLTPLTGYTGASEKPAKKENPPLTLKVGDKAPEFSLLAFDGKELKKVSLSDYRGKKNVALAFYVFAFTGG